VRISALFFLFFAEAAWAASEGGSTGRMDFANTPAFHSVFENHVASALEGQGASGVSAKMRIAVWTSSSVLPSRTETLVAVPPSAVPRVHALEPSERITAKTVRSPYLEESAHQLAKRKRFKRAVLEPLDIEEEGPSSFLEYQRRALSNRSDLDDAESAGEDAQPSFLGRREHIKPPANEDDAQPSFFGRIFGALFPQ
jgi:hypothetical protein